MKRKTRLIIVFLNLNAVFLLGLFFPKVFSAAQVIMLAISVGITLGLIKDEIEFSKTNKSLTLAMSALRFYASMDSYRETSEDEFMEVISDSEFIGDRDKIFGGARARQTISMIEEINGEECGKV